MFQLETAWASLDFVVVDGTLRHKGGGCTGTADVRRTRG